MSFISCSDSFLKKHIEIANLPDWKDNLLIIDTFSTLLLFYLLQTMILQHETTQPLTIITTLTELFIFTTRFSSLMQENHYSKVQVS